MGNYPGGRASWEADHRLTVVETMLGEHLKTCDRRGAILAKLAWLGLTVNLAVLGALAKFVLSFKGIVIP